MWFRVSISLFFWAGEKKDFSSVRLNEGINDLFLDTRNLIILSLSKENFKENPDLSSRQTPSFKPFSVFF